MKVQFNDVHVYLQTYGGSGEHELKQVCSGKTLPLFSEKACSYFEAQGYPLIGKATITVELLKPEEIHGNQVAVLRQQLQTMRAEHQRAQNALISQISKLEALTFEGAAAA